MNAAIKIELTPEQTNAVFTLTPIARDVLRRYAGEKVSTLNPDAHYEPEARLLRDLGLITHSYEATPHGDYIVTAAGTIVLERIERQGDLPQSEDRLLRVLAGHIVPDFDMTFPHADELQSLVDRGLVRFTKFIDDNLSDQEGAVLTMDGELYLICRPTIEDWRRLTVRETHLPVETADKTKEINRRFQPMPGEKLLSGGSVAVDKEQDAEKDTLDLSIDDVVNKYFNEGHIARTLKREVRTLVEAYGEGVARLTELKADREQAAKSERDILSHIKAQRSRIHQLIMPSSIYELSDDEVLLIRSFRAFQKDNKDINRWIDEATSELLRSFRDTPDVEDTWLWDHVSELAREAALRIIFDKAALLNNLTKECHGAAVSAGWWNDLYTGEDLHGKRNAGELMMLMVTELAEAFEGERKGLVDDHLPHRKSVEVELADAVIRIMDFAGSKNLDIGGALVEKMAFNAQREDHKREARLATGGKRF